MRDSRRLKIWRIRLLMFLAVVGPGFITANVDNDAGGIYTYSAAGAQFGYSLLWVMIPMTIALVVVQEMSARMGAVTGKGLSDLIREEYGLRVTFLMMLGLVITNFGNVVAEFAGIASSLELFHISRYYSVPVCCLIVWLLVVKGSLQERGKGLPCGLVLLLRLHHCGRAGRTKLEGSFHRHLQAAACRTVPRTVLSLHGDRHRRHYDRTLDAVLPAIQHRGERHHRARIPRLALGRHPRLPVHRHCRLVHRGRLRGNALRARRAPDSRRGRCRPGAASTRRRVRLHPLRRRPVQRFPVRRVDPAPSRPPTPCAKAWVSSRA